MLVREMAGHRASAFPHALYGHHKPTQASFAHGDGLWCLRSRCGANQPIGAFF